MRRVAAAALWAVLAAAPASAAGVPEAPGSSAHMLNLSCVEALVAIGHSELAGVFSFISEKDTPAAFADLIVHDKKARKKYTAKLERDFKAAQALTQWDHDALVMILSIYGSPLAETLQKPGTRQMGRLAELGQAPTTTLDQMTAKRGRL